MHAATRLSNPATRPEVRAKIAASRRHVRTSKLEDAVAPLLPGWERQVKIGWYVVDFAIVARRLIVEVQGCYWHSCQACFPGSPTTTQQRTAARLERSRRSFFANRGWTIIEVWEHDIKKRGHDEDDDHAAHRMGLRPSGAPT